MKREIFNVSVAIIAAIGFATSSLGQAPAKQGSPARPRPAPAQQVSSDKRYIVLLGSSFETAEKANELTLQLRRKYPSAHTQGPSGSEVVYRVRIGPYASRDEARQVANDLTGQGFAGVMILPWSSTSRKPASDQDEKIEPAQTQEPDEAMRRALTNLSNQIGLLADELRMMRRETERNSAMLELLLNEERLAKLEDKIQGAIDNKAQLDAREQEIGRRTRNIQGELVLRGGLRRDEAEAAIRADLQRALDDVRSQQTVYQQRVGELNAQAAGLRARVETLRKKLELLDVKSEKEEK
ncbi:MAG: SPOR domain-containing protein [Acidobacteriota bacterium]